MSFEFRNLQRMGNRVGVTIPPDEDGYTGRECPQSECEGYFKVKSGTGIIGENVPCHCPYCGHTESHNSFWTKEQIAYAKSVVMRQITQAVRADLKRLEFDHKPRGAFGIGISLKLKPGTPIPLRVYREKKLETYVTCTTCTLQYAVYGVFAFCPDCATHNSVQILEANLELVRKQVALADGVADLALKQHLIEDALENCVSSLDGFGREACRLRAHLATRPERAESLSFQNLPAAARKVKELFGFDLEALIPAAEWQRAHIGFMRRHLLAHKAGVIDQKYLDETGDPKAVLNRRVLVAADDVLAVASIVQTLGAKLAAELPPIR